MTPLTLATDEPGIFQQIEGLEERTLQMFVEKFEGGGPLYVAHLLLWGAGNRTISQCRGFSSVMQDKNFTCSAAILRMQLDTLLRLFGGFLFGDLAKYADHIFEGQPVGKLRSSDGRKLRDAVLVEELSKQQPWVSTVYDRSSGSIHLSKRHIMLVMGEVDDSGSVQVQIGPSDQRVPEDLFIELGQAFVHTTWLALGMIEKWFDNIGNDSGVWK